MQIITLLKSQDNVSDTIKDSLSKLNITNLQRLMSDPYVREHLGLGINNGTLVSKVEVSEVVKGLIKVVTDILNPEFKVSEIYNREKGSNILTILTRTKSQTYLMKRLNNGVFKIL